MPPIGAQEGGEGGGIGQAAIDKIKIIRTHAMHWWKETLPTLLQFVTPQKALLFSR